MEKFDIEKKKEIADQTVAIDFDGVIHNGSKGFHDGTVYGDVMFGAEEALRLLSRKYRIVLFSCKSNPTRPLIDGKTGTELVWEWLEKHDLAQYVDEICAEKPWALVYIDDRGLRFQNWSQCLAEMEHLHGIFK